MQRSLPLTLFLLLALVAGSLWWLLGSTAAPPPIAPPSESSQEEAAVEAVAPARGDAGEGVTSALRETVAGVGDPLLDDPDIRAGLCGFRGRVVDFRKAPVISK